MTELFNVTHVGSASLGPPAPGSLSDNLRLAASKGNVQAVKDLLVSGAGIGPDKDNRNAVHYAAQEGHAEICKYLTAHGCDVNMQDVMGYTPLLRAASQGAHETVQTLLDAGCEIDMQDEHGNAAIHETCWNGFSQTAELLVKYSCNVCLTNKAGFTALHLAAQNGHNECSRVLLYAGCNPDLQNNYGDTALHTAARYGHAGITRILISAKCKLSEQNKNGDTALHISAALKRRKIAKILVESGVDAELLNKQNERAVDVARRKEHPEIILIITSYSKPRPSSSHRSKGDNVGVTFKEGVDFEDRIEDYPVNETIHKLDPKADKQEKERRFFFFKKKKKEKEKVPPTVSHTKTEAEHVHAGHGKPPTVHGFFSQYVPRDGVQLYRDLAGNVKQGPIGYAPVCQCGPSLRRLENNITNTRESLHNHIDASHNILSQRIDHLDFQTKQQVHSTEALVQERFNNERNACHSRISERLQEERLETQAMLDQTNADVKGELEYWLNDKLASYGHCLDHHHDDSALPPRNLFFDFPAMGRLVRSRSDETLTASDCSGKFRKKDFYASRQAAMQQIRGWDVPHAESFPNQERSRKKERNNNVIPNRVVTQAQVHFMESEEGRQVSPNIHTMKGRQVSPSTNQTTLADTLTTSMNSFTLQSAEKSVGRTEMVATKTRNVSMPWKPTIHESPQINYLKKAGPHPRVTFSSDQPVHRVQQPGNRVQQPHQHYVQPHVQQPGHLVQQPHQQHVRQSPQQYVPQPYQQHAQQPYQHSHRSGGVSSPPPLGSGSIAVDQVHLARQSLRNPARSTSLSPHYNLQQNLIEGGPLRTEMKSGELGDSRISLLTGQEKNDLRNTRQQNVHPISSGCQSGYDYNYDRQRTLSADSLLNEERYSFSSRHVERCHSVENTLDDSDSKKAENSGYFTDSNLRTSPTKVISRNINGSQSVRSGHSASLSSRTTFRYRLPETSTSPDQAKANPVSVFDPSLENSNFQSRNPSLENSNFQSRNPSLENSNFQSRNPSLEISNFQSRNPSLENSNFQSRNPLLENSNFQSRNPSLENSNFQPRYLSSHAQSPTNASNNPNSSRRILVSKPSDMSRELSFSKTLHKSLYGLSEIADTPGPGLGTYDKKDATIYPDRSDSMSRSDGNLTSSKPHSVHFPPPVMECLQHEGLVSASTIPSPAGNKEDSTCSSNQDSGYGSRNQGGLRRGADTIEGTPSSSFSLETSGCNTPSHIDSPYTNRGDFPSTVSKTVLNNHSSLATVQDNKQAFPSTALLSQNAQNLSDGSEVNLPLYRRSIYDQSGSCVPDTFNRNNNPTVQFKNVSLENGVAKSFDSFRQNSPIYNKPSQTKPPQFNKPNLQKNFTHETSNGNRFLSNPCGSNTSRFHQESQLQSGTISDGGRETERQKPVHYGEVDKRQFLQQNYLNNHSYHERNNNADTQPAQTEQMFKPDLPRSAGTPFLPPQSGVNNQSYRQNPSQSRVPYSQQPIQSNTSQAAVQDHIQGWYQRKLMEAAQRLRQNHDYSRQNFDKHDARSDPDYPSFNRTNEFGDLPYKSEQPHTTGLQFSSQSKFPAAANSQNLQYAPTIQSHQDQVTQQTSRHQTFQQPSSPLERTDLHSGAALYNDGNVRRPSAFGGSFVSSNTTYKLPASQMYQNAASNSPYPSGMQVLTRSSAHTDSVRGKDV